MEPVSAELAPQPLANDSSVPDTESRAGTRGDRIAWFVLGMLPAVVIALATQLSPDPSGHGTHQQLGLPPCGFIYVTGYPCPGCGLTTAFSHMVRLQFVGAARANPFGILLFMVSFTTIWVSLVGFVKKLPVLRTLERLQFERWAVLLSVTAITVWAVRVATQFLAL